MSLTALSARQKKATGRRARSFVRWSTNKRAHRSFVPDFLPDTAAPDPLLKGLRHERAVGTVGNQSGPYNGSSDRQERTRLRRSGEAIKEAAGSSLRHQTGSPS